MTTPVVAILRQKCRPLANLQVDLDLIDRITIPGSKRLRISFDAVPAVPISSFALRLNGGRRGSVGDARTCARDVGALREWT